MNKIAIKPESSLEAILCLAPTISAIRAKFPEASVGIIAEECFREATELLPNVDFHLADFPSDDSIHVFDFSNFSGDSWGEESADWKAYLQGCSALGVTNPYHRVDLFRKAAGIDHADVNFELLAPAADKQETAASLEPADRLRVALCATSLGIDSLQSTLAGIHGSGIPTAVHLLGTLADRKKASLLASAWEGKLEIHDFCGRQTLLQSADTLRKCDILFTGPGASAILSSGYGTFTICIDEGRNLLHYPYGHGHLVAQRGEAEHFGPSLAGLTQEIIQFALNGNGGSIPSLEQWQSFADDRIDSYLGRIRLFATQRIEILLESGSLTELHLRPLLFLGAEIGDLFRTFYRLLWEHSLASRSLRSNDLDILHENTLEALASLLKPLEQLYELANFGHTYSRYVMERLRNGDIEGAKAESAKLQEAEDLIFTLAKSYELLAPLCAYHGKRQHLIPSDGPIQLAEQMGQQFADLKSRVLVLLDLAQSLFHTTLRNESPVTQGSAKEGE